MVKLEEDYTYLELQRQLNACRDQRERIDAQIEKIMYHINAIKRDFKRVEDEDNERIRSTDRR